LTSFVKTDQADADLKVWAESWWSWIQSGQQCGWWRVGSARGRQQLKDYRTITTYWQTCQ